MECLRMLKCGFFTQCAERFAEPNLHGSFFYAVELVREQVAAAVRAAAFVDKLQQSLTHW